MDKLERLFCCRQPATAQKRCRYVLLCNSQSVDTNLPLIIPGSFRSPIGTLFKRVICFRREGSAFRKNRRQLSQHEQRSCTLQRRDSPHVTTITSYEYFLLGTASHLTLARVRITTLRKSSGLPITHPGCGSQPLVSLEHKQKRNFIQSYRCCKDSSAYSKPFMQV
jgi:hypothetical protein